MKGSGIISRQCPLKIVGKTWGVLQLFHLQRPTFTGGLEAAVIARASSGVTVMSFLVDPIITGILAIPPPLEQLHTPDILSARH